MPEAQVPQPQPIPTHFNVSPVAAPGYKGVVLQIASATGMAVYFAPLHVARTLSANIAQCARLADESPVPQASGLIVPDVDMGEVLKNLNQNGGRN